MGASSYTRTQIALHWIVAALVLGQYATSGAITRTHQIRMIGQHVTSSDLTLHMLHNRIGLLIVALMGFRLLVRWRRGAPAPLPDRGTWAAQLAGAAHWGFYALLIAQGVTGAIATYFWWPISGACRPVQSLSRAVGRECRRRALAHRRQARRRVGAHRRHVIGATSSRPDVEHAHHAKLLVFENVAVVHP